MKYILSLIVILMLCNPLSAQESSLKVSGELRVRSEADGRDLSITSPMNFYTLSRVRLGFEANPADALTVFVCLQDSRTFGEETASGSFNTVANFKNIDLYEGYVVVKNFFAPSLSIKLGRQMMQFGNERIIGALNWNNIGRAFDGVRLTIIPSSTSALDLFVMNAGETNIPPSGLTPAAVAYKRDDGQWIAGAFFSEKHSPSLLYEGYALYQNITKRPLPGKDSLIRATFGARVKGMFNAITVDAEAAGQAGTMNGTDIVAYMAALSVGYSLNSPLISSASVNLDVLSGTAPTTVTENNTFEPPFSTGHKFFGFMDYFTNVYTHMFGRGMNDLYLRTNHSITSDVSVSPTLHYFTLAEKRTTATADKFLGTELDIITQYRYNKNLVFEFGVCGFVPGATIRTVYGNSDIGIWSYLMTTVSF